MHSGHTLHVPFEGVESKCLRLSINKGSSGKLSRESIRDVGMPVVFVVISITLV